MSLLEDFKNEVPDLLKTNRFVVEFPEQWNVGKNQYMLISSIDGLNLSTDKCWYSKLVTFKILMSSKTPSIFSAVSKVINRYNNGFMDSKDLGTIRVHQLDNSNTSVFAYNIKVNGIELEMPVLSMNDSNDSIHYAKLHIEYKNTIEIEDIETIDYDILYRIIKDNFERNK